MYVQNGTYSRHGKHTHGIGYQANLPMSVVLAPSGSAGIAAVCDAGTERASVASIAVVAASAGTDGTEATAVAGDARGASGAGVRAIGSAVPPMRRASDLLLLLAPVMVGFVGMGSGAGTGAMLRVAPSQAIRASSRHAASMLVCHWAMGLHRHRLLGEEAHSQHLLKAFAAPVSRSAWNGCT